MRGALAERQPHSPPTTTRFPRAKRPDMKRVSPAAIRAAPDAPHANPARTAVHPLPTPLPQHKANYPLTTPGPRWHPIGTATRAWG